MISKHEKSVRRFAVAGIAALTLATGMVAANAPAQAFGGHGGGAIFRPGGFGHGGLGGGFGRGGLGHGGFVHNGFGHGGLAYGGFHNGGFRRGIGYGLGGLGLGLAAGGLYGAYDNYGYGYGCLRNVQTAYGVQTVNVCNG